MTSLKRSRMAVASLSSVLFALLLLAVSLPVSAQAHQPEVSQFRTLSVSSDDAPPVREVIVKFKSDDRVASAQSHRNLGADFVRHSEMGRFDVVRVPEGRTVDDVVQYYLAGGLVEYAEPNYPVSATWEPNDPYYYLQWHFDQVKAEAAWDMQQGGSSLIVVAVLDTGVAYENNTPYVRAPDLSGTAFVPGYDFVNSDAHPNDDNGHGTHVAGTIAQTTNNGHGVAGLAFGVSIMPVKVLGANGSGWLDTVAEGVYYAVEYGAHVINMSLGGSSALPPQTLTDALDYAYDKGLVVVASAGNEGPTGPDQYPAAYETTIAVGATGYDSSRASYSNTGNYVDVVAPGGDGSYYVWQETFAVGDPTDFKLWGMQGTSMAAPHVSAAAALLLSINPNLSHDDVRFILEYTSVDLGAEGWDAEYGHGLLDVAAALAMSVTEPVVTTDPAGDIAGTTVTLNGTLVNYGWELCEYSFQYGTVQGGPYTQTDWCEETITIGNPFSESITGLQKGTVYYFRAAAKNSAGIGYGVELSFTTLPDAPSGLTATPGPYAPFYRINLEWTSGAGASDTFIVAKVGAYVGDYPEDREDGVVVYDGPGESFVHSGLEPETTYYYRAWSRVSDHQGADVWSDLYAEAEAMTAVEPATVDFGITLQPGWNLVSVPLWLPDMSTSEVFQGAVVYTWNADTKSYVVPAHIVPEKAYWVAVTVDTTLPWHGVPVSVWDSPIAAGWNMVGSVYRSGDEPVAVSSLGDDPQDSILSNAIYRWDPDLKSFETATFIEPGKGYWLATTLDCNLLMPAP